MEQAGSSWVWPGSILFPEPAPAILFAGSGNEIGPGWAVHA